MTRKKLLATTGAVVVVAAVLAALHFTVRGLGAHAARAEDETQVQRTYPVRIAPLTRQPFENALLLQGNVSAKRYAGVPARVFGVLDAVFVEEGDLVKKGVTKLFQVDRKNLDRAVLLAEQDQAVAACGLRESEANLERIEASLRKAKTDLERYERLAGKEAATAEMLERQHSRYDQELAGRKHAAALVDLTRERLRQAEIAVDIAKKNLSDSVVAAPLDGVVTQRRMEPGEIAEPGKTILRIEDLSTLEIATHVPAAYYGQVAKNETFMEIQMGGEHFGSFPVSHKSPDIDTMLRTFEIQCLLEGLSDSLAPGAMVEVKLAFQRHDALGVARDAIQIRGGQSVLFAVEGRTARMVPVETGFTSNGSVEVSGDGLEEGMAVVVAGQYMLDPGATVDVQGEAN